MKPVRLFLFTLLTFQLAPIAVAAVDTERLIQGCEELIDIYASHEEKRLLAGVTTSVSEAMRAGYCQGVISEYQRTKSCSVSDWYLLASRIAEMPTWQAEAKHATSLLETACGN